MEGGNCGTPAIEGLELLELAAVQCSPDRGV